MKATFKVLELISYPEGKYPDGNVSPAQTGLRLLVHAHNPLARPEIHWATVLTEGCTFTKDTTFEADTTDFSATLKTTAKGVYSKIKVSAFKYA